MIARTLQTLAIASGCALVVVGAANADYEAGWSAYVRGDFAAAHGELAPAAAVGDPRAQYLLGVMYAGGQGVAPDALAAYKWLTCIAEVTGGVGERARVQALRSELEATLDAERLAKARARAARDCKLAPAGDGRSETEAAILYELVRGSVLETVFFLPGDLAVLGALFISKEFGIGWIEGTIGNFVESLRYLLTGLIAAAWWLLLVWIVILWAGHRAAQMGRSGGVVYESLADDSPWSLYFQEVREEERATAA